MSRPMKFPKNSYNFGLAKTIECSFDCMGFDKEHRMAVVGCKNNTYNKKIEDPDLLTLGQLKSIAKKLGMTVHELLNPENFITNKL